MALLPGYRWVEIGEMVPKVPCYQGEPDQRILTKSKAAGWPCEVPETYMVPVVKPRRVRSYMPTETSLQAHESQKDKAPNDGARILRFIKDIPSGRTCDEVETLLQFSHQTASARIRDLSKGGFLVDSGIRRKTRTGRAATVWKASK